MANKYVRDMNPAELRAHMKRLKGMAGWHEPLADSLFAEIERLDRELASNAGRCQQCGGAKVAPSPMMTGACDCASNAGEVMADSLVSRILAETPGPWGAAFARVQELEMENKRLRAALATAQIVVTEEMMEAGARSIICGQENRLGSSWAEEAKWCFEAMLAAAPAKPEGEGAALPYPRHGEPGALEQGDVL